MNVNFDSYKRQFKAKAINYSYSEENIQRCLNYAQPLISNGLPVIYNLSHLSLLVGYSKDYIVRAIRHEKYFYRYFRIKKKNGNFRGITEPLPSLKEIQLWILNEILYKIKVSRYAKAYVNSRSIKAHVKYHTREKKVLTLDIEDFFGSINSDKGVSIFKSFGYSDHVSSILGDLCFLDNSLPQGAPTSPYLTNIVMFSFDEVIAEYSKEAKIKYTRYSDDLAFSGDLMEDEIINLVEIELAKLGLLLNRAKTKLMKPNVRQEISGVIVNQKTQVPKSKRNKIRNEMFYIKKFGLSDHMNRVENDKDNYLKHLVGKINYILFLNPNDEEFIGYKEYLYEEMNSHQ